MNGRDDEQDSNEETNDPEAATPVSLMSLLGGFSADKARMGCARYHDAEHVFFSVTQVTLNYLAKKWGAGICEQPSGPSHWLAVFQLACEIAQRDKGDFILCALFAPIHELGRDWADDDAVHSAEWTANGLEDLGNLLKSWRKMELMLNRYVSPEYIEQIGTVLPRVLYWNGMRWFQDQVNPDDELKYSLEGFHPALTAAAHACMDAEYISICLWGNAKPNPKLAYTAAGRQVLHDILLDWDDDDDSEGEEWKREDRHE